MVLVVFITYRRDDSGVWAALLYHKLVATLGKDRVFLDSESIPAGVDFTTEVLAQVRQATAVLVVIGPAWLAAADSASRRRIDDPADWLRRELIEAFRHDIRVIPVLTDGATLPREADLPADIAKLVRCQALRLRQSESSHDLDRILEALGVPRGRQVGQAPGAEDHPAGAGPAAGPAAGLERPDLWGSVSTVGGALRRHRAAAAVLAVLVTLAGVLVAVRWPGWPSAGVPQRPGPAAVTTGPSPVTRTPTPSDPAAVGPGSGPSVDVLPFAQRGTVYSSGGRPRRFGRPPTELERDRGYAFYASGVELQDGSRAELAVVASLPLEGSASPDERWLGLDIVLPVPLHAADVLKTRAGLPRNAAPELRVTFVLECSGGGHPAHTVAGQRESASLNGAPWQQAVAMSRCDGATHLRLVAEASGMSGRIQAIWAEARLVTRS